MSWLFGSKNQPPSVPGLPQIVIPQPSASGGADEGDKSKDSKMEMEYSFDSSALERATQAANELLENSEHARDALLLIQEQEWAKAIEAQKQIKEYEANIEQLKLEQVRVAAEERKKLLAEEAKQHQYKAQYDDQLARKRYEDQLVLQARVNEENLRKQEESVKKQEAIRLATIEKEAELRHKNDMLRIQAEMQERAKMEQENWNITKERIKLQAAEDRKNELDAINTYSQSVGMAAFLNNLSMITAFMNMPKTCGKLKPADEHTLRANYFYLADEIDALYLVAELFSQFVIDANEKEQILSKATARERTLLLLDILLDSGPGEAYNKFVQVLTKEYPDAAKKLKEEAPFEVTPQPQYSWYAELSDEVKNCMITEADASRISAAINGRWRHVMALLGIKDVEIQQELFNHPHAGPSDFITTFLIKWKQRQFRQATVDKLVSVLKEVHEAGTCTVDWAKVEKALKKNVPQV